MGDGTKLESGDSARSAKEPSKPVALIFCNDLMFASRLQSMARKSGFTDKLIRPGIAATDGRVLLVDIADRGDWEAAVGKAHAAGISVVAFGPHMDSEGRARARAAGASRVLANSNLERDLPGILLALGDSVSGGEDGSN